jgi:hypothetical protein
MPKDNGQERCAHVLCGRDAWEREQADAECALDDCPFKEPPPTTEPELSALGRAVRLARGGEAPTEKKGYA